MISARVLKFLPNHMEYAGHCECKSCKAVRALAKVIAAAESLREMHRILRPPCTCLTCVALAELEAVLEGVGVECELLAPAEWVSRDDLKKRW